MKIYNLYDLFVLIIIIYSIIYIIINIYKYFLSLKSENSKIQDNEEDNKEFFKNSTIGYSLKNLTNKIYVSFPGNYIETIYRPATITTSVKNIIYALLNPILIYLNNTEGYNFTVSNLIYLIHKKYTNDSIYYLKTFIIDGYRAISQIIKLEAVIDNNSKYSINSIIIRNKDNFTKPTIFDITKKTPVFLLKNTILPMLPTYSVSIP